jgi:flavin reductase (DIM6/NTAB) family NADH-FMN oxidoreductase RutF
VPRPIGRVSTVSHDGIVNLAPFSQFNNLAYDPPYVMFSANSFPATGRRKDSVKNALATSDSRHRKNALACGRDSRRRDARGCG